jgi:hypothetical protein
MKEETMNHFKLALFTGALVELAFLVAFLMLADFSQRLHVLLFVATVAAYTIVVIGLVALGAWLRQTRIEARATS